MANGEKIDGVATLRQALLKRPDVFVQTLTEKLLVYALGRGLTAQDMPVVRTDRPRRTEPGLSILGAGCKASSRVCRFRCGSNRPIRTWRRRSPRPSSRAFQTGDQLMFITKMSLPRRTFLRGMGVTLALPLVDAMVPAATALAKTPGAASDAGGLHLHPARRRHGHRGRRGRPAPASSCRRRCRPGAWSRSRIRLSVISNLKRAGTTVEMHAAAASGWLSGAIPKRTEGEDYKVGTTIDQVVAKQIGQSSPFPSLEFATEDFTGYIGGCTPGYSCAYMNTISWASPTTPLPMEINPRNGFERLFGDGGIRRPAPPAVAGGPQHPRCDRRARPRRCRAGSASATGRAWPTISTTSARSNGGFSRLKSRTRTDIKLFDKPLGIPDSFEEHTALMTDLLAMAFQADLTNVFTFMMSREGSQRTFPRDRRSRSVARGVASRGPGRKGRAGSQDQRAVRPDGRAVRREAASRRPTATARCSITR